MIDYGKRFDLTFHKKCVRVLFMFCLFLPVINATTGPAKAQESRVWFESVVTVGADVSVEQNEQHSQPRADAPNLKPYTPEGWSGPIVVSQYSGTTTETTVTAGQTAYIDFAWMNDGYDCYTPHKALLYINGVMRSSNTVQELMSGEGAYVKDFQYTFPQAGVYSVRMVLDPEEEVIEGTENDNQYTAGKTIPLKGESPYTGWWYTPDESGTGVSMEIQNDILYLVWYVYTQEGEPIWYASWAEKEISGSYYGNVRRYTGWEKGTEWTEPTFTYEGTVTVKFNDADNARMTWYMSTTRENPGETRLKRYMPSLGYGLQDPRKLAGWWIDNSKPGMGIFLEAQANSLFGGWFHYKEDGSPHWQTFGGWKDPGGFPLNAPNYTTALQEYENGQTTWGVYKAPESVEIHEYVTLVFGGSAQSPVITLSWQGNTYTMERYRFYEVP